MAADYPSAILKKGISMKIVKFVSAILSVMAIGSFVHATTKTEVCGTFFECGNYKMLQKTSDGSSITTTFNVSAKGPGEGHLDYVAVTDKNEVVRDLHFTFVFQEDGTFFMRMDGRETVFAAGVCSGMICTYGLRPFHDGANQLVGNAGSLRFSENKVFYDLIWGLPGEMTHGLQTFEK